MKNVQKIVFYFRFIQLLAMGFFQRKMIFRNRYMYTMRDVFFFDGHFSI